MAAPAIAAEIKARRRGRWLGLLARILLMADHFFKRFGKSKRKGTLAGGSAMADWEMREILMFAGVVAFWRKKR